MIFCEINIISGYFHAFSNKSKWLLIESMLLNECNRHVFVMMYVLSADHVPQCPALSQSSSFLSSESLALCPALR